MSRVNDYREVLSELNNWTPYLLKNSGLPGPRGNLELAQAFAELATAEQIDEFLSLSPIQAPENSAKVFLVVCSVTALGKLASRADRDKESRAETFIRLRKHASDPRWRVREAVAIALQYVGDVDMRALLKEMQVWSKGNWYEKRAVAASLAEPRLLKDIKIAVQVLQIFDGITTAIASASDSHSDAFKVLRQSMGYCWSVAVAASPKDGKPLLEKWLATGNTDIRWIIKENLKKKRLIRMDTQWVAECMVNLEVAS